MDELERLRELLASMGLSEMDDKAGVPTEMPSGTLRDALDEHGGWGAMEGYGDPEGKRNITNDTGSATMAPRGMLPGVSRGSSNKVYNVQDIINYIRSIKAGGSYG